MNMNAELTRREREIAELIAWGASKKDIANKLFISIRTAENHARNIFEKTGVTKLNELSAWFFCREFNISMDLSPLRRKTGSAILLLLLSFELFNYNSLPIRLTRPSKVNTIQAAPSGRKLEND